jgi:rhodanese-related sulfurtransferase
MPITDISAEQLQHRLQNQEDFVLLDVREDNEFAHACITGSLHIPLRQLPQAISQLDASRDLVVLCHHGVRSQQACLFLEQYGFERLYNLRGGIDAWSLNCDPTVPRY